MGENQKVLCAILAKSVCVGGESAARESLVRTFVTANTKRQTMRELREIIEEQTKIESHRSGKDILFGAGMLEGKDIHH